MHFKCRAFVYLCPFKTTLEPPQNCLLAMQSVLLPISSPCLPHSSAPPRGLVLLLTGVICVSGIDVVCWPIKIFEGNVYFLERIAPAACKLFWIRPFICKNLPLWSVVLDRSVTECWFGPLQRKWRSSRGSADLTHAEPSVAIGEQLSATNFSGFSIFLCPNCRMRMLGVSQQWKPESWWGRIPWHIFSFCVI